MTTLDKINGEALAVPGLTFRAWRPPRIPTRFGIIAQNELGAVELWSEPNPPAVCAIVGDESMGGVEIHSPKQLYDFAPEPVSEHCDILGGPCWCDGSSLAYSETFLPLIRAGASAAILQKLADWHHSHFATGEA